MTTDTFIPAKQYAPQSWEEAKRVFAREFGSHWVFRGQRDHRWSLESGLDRLVIFPLRQHGHQMQFLEEERYGPAFHEPRLLQEFQRRAHHYLDNTKLPGPDDLFEWWALMQHHGAPTRLLDCTRSPYVAAFFALEAAEKTDPAHLTAAVWAIDAAWCYREAAKRLRSWGRDFPLPADLDNPLFYMENPANLPLPHRTDFWPTELVNAVLIGNWIPFVVALAPFRMNERLAVQQALFLLPGTAKDSFAVNLLANGDNRAACPLSEADFQQRVIKVLLPFHMRQDALYDLDQMNINRATLFPGLDGFAASLRTSPFLYVKREYGLRP